MKMKWSFILKMYIIKHSEEFIIDYNEKNIRMEIYNLKMIKFVLMIKKCFKN